MWHGNHIMAGDETRNINANTSGASGGYGQVYYVKNADLDIPGANHEVQGEGCAGYERAPLVAELGP